MYNKQYPPIFVLFFFLSVPLLAQHQINGVVTDIQQDPISYANVVLFKAEDSTTVVKGAVTDETGNFSFEDIAAEAYVIRVSFVGFNDHLQRIQISEDTRLNAIRLALMASELEEVAITAKRPRIRREVDRLVFEVENSSLSSGNTWEILTKTPMVIVSNGSLQVRNQVVQIYINDRKVHLSPSELQLLLENYSAENIRSIEVITNPPARYDAEGGAILNIVTSKGITPGYKGNVNGAYTQAIYPKYNLGTSHYLQTEKVDLFANYSFSPRKEFKEDLSYINFRENGQVYERWESDFDKTTRSKAHNLNFMLDYSLDPRNSLSFSSNVLVSPGKTFNNQVLTERRNPQVQLNSHFATTSALEEDLSNLGMDLQFRHQLAREGAEITVKGHYTRYDQDRGQDVSTAYFSNTGEALNTSAFSTDAVQGINIYTGQLDYLTPWGSTQFEAGAKASVIDSESGIDYLNENGIRDQDLSDRFFYDEEIFAGYANISREWEKLSLQAGLRGEFTSREGRSLSVEEANSREYFELFPTFFGLYTLNDQHSFSFDYSRRIQRPRYESLNPFRYFLNEHNYSAGNPNLVAAVSDNFNLNYTLNNIFFFDLYFRDNGPRPEIFSFQDNQQQTIRSMSVNLLESTSYGFDFNHGRSLTSFWYLSTYMSVFHDSQTFLALESTNEEVTIEVDGFYGSLSNYFTLSKDGSFTADLHLTYVSDYISGSYYLDPMTTLSLGLRKTLWNNRAEVSLYLNDILDKTNTRLTSRYLDQDNSFFAQPESRWVRLGFKYNFGNFRLSDNQRSVGDEERNRL